MKGKKFFGRITHIGKLFSYIMKIFIYFSMEILISTIQHYKRIPNLIINS